MSEPHPPGSLRVFTKSGNKVRVLRRVDGLYEVERVDTGKEMIVPGAGLVLPEDGDG